MLEMVDALVMKMAKTPSCTSCYRHFAAHLRRRRRVLALRNYDLRVLDLFGFRRSLFSMRALWVRNQSGRPILLIATGWGVCPALRPADPTARPASVEALRFFPPNPTQQLCREQARQHPAPIRSEMEHLQQYSLPSPGRKLNRPDFLRRIRQNGRNGSAEVIWQG